MQVNIEPVIREMAMWAVGFAVFSVVYLIVGVWLIRRRRAGRESEAHSQTTPTNLTSQSGQPPLTGKEVTGEETDDVPIQS